MKGTAMKIFNFHQANCLFKNGCEIINMGISNTDKMPYVRFLADDKFKKYMKEWQERCKSLKK